MNTKNKTLVSDRVRTFTGKLGTVNALGIAGHVIDALRHADPTTSKSSLIAVANFVAAVVDVPWHHLDFDVTAALAKNGRAYEVALQYGAKEQDIQRLLLEALAVFSDILADGGVINDDGVTPADIFDAVVAELADNSQAPAPAVKAPPPEIYSPKMVTRVFEPAPFSMELAGKLKMTLVTYKGTQGNDLLGLAFAHPQAAESYALILETGECLQVKHTDCSTATIDEESYEAIPAALLAFVNLATPELELGEIVPFEVARAIEEGALGKFKTDICTINVLNGDLQPLMHVIDTAREAGSMGVTGATGPTGALLKFPVPNVPGLFVVLEAQVETSGPYVLARLVDSSAGTERVLMRLDQPRHDAVKGLYFFPHAKQAVVLKA